MVSRSVGWRIVSSVAVLLVTPPARAQSSASFPDEPKQPAPVPAAPAPAAPTPVPAARPAPAPTAPAPAPAVTPPPPLAADAIRGPRPPQATPGPIDDVRFPVRQPAPASAGAPPILPYRDGLPVPSGYTVVDRPATTLIAAGVVGLGISYATAVIIGASQGFENGTGLLAVPLFGPYAAIATREYDCSVDTVAAAKRCTANETQIVTLIAVDGLAQTAGALVAVAGLVSGRKELVRSDLPEVSVTPPISAKSGWQFSVRGDF